MQGWICLEQRTEGYWLVNFPQCGEKDDIAEISVKEEDLKVIPVMNAAINEEIKAQFEKNEDIGDISDYLIQDKTSCLRPANCYGEKEDIADIGIHEEDLKRLPSRFDAKLNERIKAQFDALEDISPISNLSDYMV